MKMAKGPAGIARPLVDGSIVVLMTFESPVSRKEAVRVEQISGIVFDDAGDISIDSTKRRIAYTIHTGINKDKLDDLEKRVSGIKRLSNIEIKPN